MHGYCLRGATSHQKEEEVLPLCKHQSLLLQKAKWGIDMGRLQVNQNVGRTRHRVAISQARRYCSNVGTRVNDASMNNNFRGEQV